MTRVSNALLVLQELILCVSLARAFFYCLFLFYHGLTTFLFRPCLRGYVCLAGATSTTPINLATQNGYECPPGYYCPAQTPVPIACPIATYQPYPLMYDPLNCTSCTANSYNNLVGQPACFPCGSSAYSLAGATTCICNGTNRSVSCG